jgi:hypothetical protein
MSVQSSYNLTPEELVSGQALTRESSLTFIAGQRILAGRIVRISDTNFKKVVPVANNVFRVISTLTASQTITLRIAKLENEITDYYNFTIPFNSSHTTTMNNLKNAIETTVPNCSVTLLSLGSTIPNHALISTTNDDAFIWLADADVSGGGWVLNMSWATTSRFIGLGVAMYKNGMPPVREKGDTVEILIDGIITVPTVQSSSVPLDANTYYMGGGDDYEQLGKISFVQNKDSNVAVSNFRPVSGIFNSKCLFNMW